MGSQRIGHNWATRAQILFVVRILMVPRAMSGINSLLTGGFLQKLTAVADNFYSDRAQNSFCYFINTLQVIAFNIWTPDTPVKSSNLRETVFKLLFSRGKGKCIPQHQWVSCPLSISESITKVFCLFIALMFTSSESELYSEDTSIYIAQPIRESVCIKFTKKLFTQNFFMHRF